MGKLRASNFEKGASDGYISYKISVYMIYIYIYIYVYEDGVYMFS